MVSAKVNISQFFSHAGHYGSFGNLENIIEYPKRVNLIENIYAVWQNFSQIKQGYLPKPSLESP